MKKVIAVYPLTNTASVNIYELIFDIDDYVLAGINDEEPEKCKIIYTYDEDGEEDTHFYLGELKIPLSECMNISN